mmetsp:Transcript_22018/g.34567  ORF Transcript_22018/g.34567 Transcript_22018/m.34567 type:complete len:426 (-) Transcript_22018:2380-3657(-)
MPKPDPPNRDAAGGGAAATGGAAAGACEPNWKAAVGAGSFAAAVGAAAPKAKAGAGVATELSFFSVALVAWPNLNEGSFFSAFIEGAPELADDWPKEKPDAPAGAVSLFFFASVAADPNANELAALSVFFSDGVLPNANVAANAAGASSFLVAAPNPKDAVGVDLFSVALEPNENPAPTLAFFFPPPCFPFSSSSPRPLFGFGSLEDAPNLNAPVLAVSPLFSSQPDEAELWAKPKVAFVFDDGVEDEDAEGAPKLNPPLPFDASPFLSSLPPTLLSVFEGGAANVFPPKLNPPEDGFVLAGVALPKENPELALILLSSFSTCTLAFDGVAPNLIAGVLVEAVEELALPNENPPAPILPADAVAVDEGAPNLIPPVPALAFLSLPFLSPPGVGLEVPSLGASQDKQVVSSSGFCEVQTLHFHCFF